MGVSERLPRTRNFGLDVARAAAIAGVFIAHGFTVNGLPLLGDLHTGVDLFFVLSGFLIGRIYFRSHARGNFSVGPFWLSRWWRTLPPYFAALALHAVLARWIGELHVGWYYILFLQNEIGMQGFPPSWSLCVEEHFYLLLPLLGGLTLYLLPRKALRWLLPSAFFIPMLLLSISVYRSSWLPWHFPVPDGFMTQYCCEGLIGGLWLAYLYVECPEQWLHLRSYARFAWLLVPISLLIDPVKPFGVATGTIYAIGYLASVRMLYDLKWEPPGALGGRTKQAITGVALAAYSIYLCHYLVFEVLRSHLLASMPRGIEKSAITLTGSALFCALFYFAVERPSILSRDRFIADHGRLLPSTAVPDEQAALSRDR